MKKIELSYEGTVFNRIAGNEKKAMYYNERLNNLLIVTTDEKAEVLKELSEHYTELYKNGELDDDEVAFDENGNIAIDIDEDCSDTIEDAIGFIVGDRWDNLCLAVEYWPNTVTLIHKPYHTTTDYIINYDLNPKQLLDKTISEAVDAVYESVPEFLENVEPLPADLPESYLKNIAEHHGKARCYKTIQIMDGKAYRCGEIPEEVFETHFE
ncbi:hypothetical protein [Metabacillus halosaccharovorans]|uniref:hypothetical protein n=1 Tax=Metabacillus halosaccharovorans TaxID=930124 RepID=UPI001C1F6AC8|nr:hypothetical protein [Metabacillus halosaccharovorans]MBU7593549.1 hypothetical protein [Metabacillus halosaccharovorans]